MNTSLVRAEEPIVWKKNTEISTALRSEFGITWAEKPLKVGLGNLAKECRMAIWLDRRIDPDQLVRFSASNEPLEALLTRLAGELNLSLTRLDDVLYFAPPGEAAKLRAMLYLRKQEIAKLPKEQQSKWLNMRAYQWEALTKPRALILQQCETEKIQIANPEFVPHDLWSEWKGPEMTSVTGLTLLLAGFGMTWEWVPTGNEIRLVPIPKKVVYEEIHEIVGDQLKIGKELKAMFPEVALRKEGTKSIGITATAEEQAQIAMLLAGKEVVKAAPPAMKRYTLTVENQPRGAILKTLATQLGVALKFDASLNDALSERVSLSVKQVTLEELFRQVLDPVNLKAAVKAELLEITTAKN